MIISNLRVMKFLHEPVQLKIMLETNSAFMIMKMDYKFDYLFRKQVNIYTECNKHYYLVDDRHCDKFCKPGVHGIESCNQYGTPTCKPGKLFLKLNHLTVIWIVRGKMSVGVIHKFF